MALQQELTDFYARHGFGQTPGARPLTVPVYTGCLLVPLPNIETRHRYLKYHDLHHLITGYSVGRIGEGEVSAWELGTGSLLASPLLAAMNWIALSTGLVLQPRRMWRAFVRGAGSRNLYSPRTRARIDAGEWDSVADLRGHALAARPVSPLLLACRAPEFACYAAIAMLIHAAIAGPALVARVITDVGLGYRFFEIIKPKKRADLY
jgi:hypothetical protein